MNLDVIKAILGIVLFIVGIYCLTIFLGHIGEGLWAWADNQISIKKEREKKNEKIIKKP